MALSFTRSANWKSWTTPDCAAVARWAAARAASASTPTSGFGVRTSTGGFGAGELLHAAVSAETSRAVDGRHLIGCDVMPVERAQPLPVQPFRAASRPFPVAEPFKATSRPFPVAQPFRAASRP